tara:strand:- start:752 stop:1030 length:279 start_codon:yes stop_codon:yes gene_type:complete
MRNIIERFDSICKKADDVNRKIKLTDESSGYGPRFFKMQHKKQNRLHSVGIYDYYTKNYVLFEMVNLVGQKGKVPQEFYDMENMLKNALPQH